MQGIGSLFSALKVVRLLRLGRVVRKLDRCHDQLDDDHEHDDDDDDDDGDEGDDTIAIITRMMLVLLFTLKIKKIIIHISIR